MENVEGFIDQLIDEKGYSDLDDDVRQELKTDMIQRLMDQIDQAAINALPEDKAIELADKLDDELFDDEKVAEFMQNSGIDLQQVALETMLQFRMLYLGEAEVPTSDENAETETPVEETAEVVEQPNYE